MKHELCTIKPEVLWPNVFITETIEFVLFTALYIALSRKGVFLV